MSAVESAQQAARLADPVGHGLGMLGMVGGAILGAVAAGLLIAGGIVTGGALIAVVVAGCVAGGGLAGGQLLRGIQRAAGLSNPTTGKIGIGSHNVRIGGLSAARAELDFAAGCNGLPLNHFPQSAVPVAEGSATVRINGMLAARVTSRLVCGAPITEGKENVYIGGPTQQVLPIHDNEELLRTGLEYLGLAALAGGAILAAAAGGAALLGFAAWTAGGMIGFAGLGWIGDQIGPGWGDILQGAGGLLLLGASGKKGWDNRGKIIREDSRPYSSQGSAPGRVKSHIDKDGNLRPANPDGDATLAQHIRGAEPKKSDSPYTSFKGDARAGKNYGSEVVRVNKKKLQPDIESGKVKGVEIIDNNGVMKVHEEAIVKAQNRYDANPSPKNLERLENARRDRDYSIRDEETAVKGVIPKDYITIGPSGNSPSHSYPSSAGVAGQLISQDD